MHSICPLYVTRNRLTRLSRLFMFTLMAEDCVKLRYFMLELYLGNGDW